MSNRDGFASLVRSVLKDELKSSTLLRDAVREEVEHQLGRRGYEAAPPSPHPAGAQPSAVRVFLGTMAPGKYGAPDMMACWRAWAPANGFWADITYTMLGRRLGQCPDLVKRIKDGRSWYIVLPRKAAVLPAAPTSAPANPQPLQQAAGEAVRELVPITPPLERPAPAPIEKPRQATQEPVRRFLEGVDEGEHDLFELHVQWRVWAFDQPEGQNCVTEAEFNRRVKAAVDLGAMGRGGVWRRFGGAGGQAAE